MAQVSVQNLHKSFGAAAVIHGVDVDIADGEIVVNNLPPAERDGSPAMNMIQGTVVRRDRGPGVGLDGCRLPVSAESGVGDGQTGKHGKLQGTIMLQGVSPLLNAEVVEVVEAVLSVMPLDAFVDDSAARMEVVGAPGDVPAVPQEVQTAIDAAEGKPWPMISFERFAFYQRAKQAHSRDPDR